MIGCLGRVPSRQDLRSLPLRRYLLAQDYPAPPPARDWTGPFRYPYLLNDRIGCCTITGLAHLAQAHAVAHSETFEVSDADILKAYRAVSGYDGTPATDRGAQMIDALVYARNVGIGGWKLGAFVRVNPRNSLELRAAINLFGGVYVGCDLPRRIQRQGTEWSLPPLGERTELDEPNSLGGHAFAVLGYDRLLLRSLPWVTPTTISNAWWDLYGSECWAFVAESWVSGARPAPNGFDLARLRQDLEDVTR